GKPVHSEGHPLVPLHSYSSVFSLRHRSPSVSGHSATPIKLFISAASVQPTSLAILRLIDVNRARSRLIQQNNNGSRNHKPLLVHSYSVFLPIGDDTSSGSDLRGLEAGRKPEHHKWLKHVALRKSGTTKLTRTKKRPEVARRSPHSLSS